MIESFILLHFLQKSFCASKILFNNNKLDLKADLCRTSKGDLTLQIGHLNKSHIPNWSAFPGAFYSNDTIKQTYKIALLPSLMNGRRLRKIADSLQLYLDCFENPYTVAGCRLPRSSCKTNQTKGTPTGVSNTTGFSNIQIDIEESMDTFKLQCIKGTKKRISHQTNKARRSIAGIHKCCPRAENLICFGCNKISTGKTHISFCPKGFVCLGKIPIGVNNGKRHQSTSMKHSERFINVTYTTRKLLYRYRRSTEMFNTVEELQALYDLKIIRKALQVITDDFPTFV